MKKIVYLIAFILTTVGAKAQQGFGTNTPAPSSVVDMTATNKGALLPRVNLTSTTDVTTVPSPVDALTIFNKATTTTGTNDVSPGYYYWSTVSSQWIRLLSSTNSVSPWNVANTTIPATLNTQNIYQNGMVGIGTNNPLAQLHVVFPTFALQPAFERTAPMPGNPSIGYVNNIAAGAGQFLYNTLGSPITTYTGTGIGATVSGMSVGFNFGFKSNTDAIKYIASITGGITDYALGKGQLNFTVNGSGSTIPSMVLNTNGMLSIGLTAPTNTLHIKPATGADPVRFEGLNTDATTTDNVLVATSTGVIQTLPQATINAANWQLAGNAATAANFLGTTNNIDLVFKRNNVQAGLLNPTNTAFGVGDMSVNTGSYNAAVGAGAMAANTTGQLNTAMGYLALAANTTGIANTALGDQAMSTGTSSNNTAVGWHALNNNTGNVNVAVGYDALGSSQSTGFLSAQTGVQNVALGPKALRGNLSGGDNIAIGYQAMLENTAPGGATGAKNIAIGTNSLSTTSTGSNNVGIGYGAGQSITTGGNNTLIGYGAGMTAGTLTNTAAIGSNAIVGANNSMVLGSINGLNGATASTNVGIGTTIPNSTLQVIGTMSLPITTTTGNFDFTAGNTNYYTVIYTGTTTATFTLPDPTTCTGRMYRLVNATSSQIVTLSRPITLLNGVTTTTLNTITASSSATLSDPVTGNTALIQSDGTQWWRIGL